MREYFDTTGTCASREEAAAWTQRVKAAGKNPLTQIGAIERENKEALRRQYPVLDEYLSWKGKNPKGDVGAFLGQPKGQSRRNSGRFFRG